MLEPNTSNPSHPFKQTTKKHNSETQPSHAVKHAPPSSWIKRTCPNPRKLVENFPVRTAQAAPTGPGQDHSKQSTHRPEARPRPRARLQARHRRIPRPTPISRRSQAQAQEAQPRPRPSPDPGPGPDQTLPKSSHSRRRPKVAKLYKELIRKCDSFEWVTELNFQGLDPRASLETPRGGQSRL